MSSLAANAGDQSNQLHNIHSSMRGAWQTSEHILPKVGRIRPAWPVVTNAVKDFATIATS
eukprot:5716523-Pyramimonas_sp.AAC.1